MSAVQHPPAPHLDLSQFPDSTVRAGQEVYRAHGSTRSAWWFDNGTAGRFNLRGHRGSCCTATTVDTAVRERVREHVSQTGMVDPVFASEFVVSRASAPLPHRCAAVSHTEAARHDIVRELVTMHDYTVPQAWAAAFDESGFDGVFYASAFTTGEASAYALFGDAGAPDAEAGYAETMHLSGTEACEQLGWIVALPSSRGMIVIE
ncbi:RES family NAD+ phosphorylase [Microbacterium sp. USHLN186]|uniref:RES family NAD+ phosphorylase n=1 Tax=Microbacterium sp. USHLN186 TaxID=3081286 RepID=UPI00301B518B